jgi:hypothetical protein
MNAIIRGAVAGQKGSHAISGVIAMRPTVNPFGRFIRGCFCYQVEAIVELDVCFVLV